MSNDIAQSSARLPGPARPRSRAWLVWVIVLVASAFVLVATTITRSVSENRARRPVPIPTGTHESLSAFSTPTEDLRTSSFVFEAEIPTNEGPESAYWAGRITPETKLTVNDQPITVEELAHRLENAAPMGASATVTELGKFASLDLQLAEPGP